jgi:beta-lactamase class A
MTALSALTPELDAVDGTVSVWCGRLGGGGPAFERHADATHYAASTMKVAVLAAVYRATDAGALDLDAELPVHNEFRSAAPEAPTFGCAPEDDSDTEVWQRVGGAAPLRWLARRMIVASSNLATNLCLAAVGTGAANDVYRAAGARHSVIGRGIEDLAARAAGISNLVTAADMAAVLGVLVAGQLASPRASDEMLAVLLAQERGEDLASGLPPGTRIAHKNGWVDGIRHGAGVIFPAGAAPYVLVCCTTTALAQADACALLARVAAASWADRDRL